MGDCLREVSQRKTYVSCLKEDFDDLIATAFLMDAYPLRMHSKFSFVLLTLPCLDSKVNISRILAYYGIRRTL